MRRVKGFEIKRSEGKSGNRKLRSGIRDEGVLSNSRTLAERGAREAGTLQLLDGDMEGLLVRDRGRPEQ